MKLKLNKRRPIHVTLRSYKNDSLILQHITEPIPEEDESDLYDDIHDPASDRSDVSSGHDASTQTVNGMLADCGSSYLSFLHEFPSLLHLHLTPLISLKCPFKTV
jgi:hypothetical protein